MISADSHNPRVFISYSHDSLEFMDRVLALANRLVEDGIDAHMDQYEESPAEGWPQWMRGQIKAADYVLVMCTSTYRRRFDGEEERGKGKGATWEGAIITQQLYNEHGRNTKFIPVILASEHAVHIPDVLQGATYYNPSTDPGYEELYRRVTRQPRIVKPKLGQVRALGQAVGPGPVVPTTGVKPAVSLAGVPHGQNLHFVGREVELAAMHQEFTGARARTVAIHGLGGMGKTQLAVEYCYRQAGEYRHILWVQAEQPDLLPAQFAELAGVLGLKEAGAQERAVAVAAVRAWLEQNSGWLLVFDNVDEPAQVADWVPRNPMRNVLITSRNPNWRHMAAPISLTKWLLPESADFLQRRTGQQDESAARELADELDGLPLALEQAAAYIETAGKTLAGYLALYGEHKLAVLNRAAHKEYPHTVATTWQISFAAVQQASPGAAALLYVCAFLAPDRIPLDLINAGAGEVPKPLHKVAANLVQLDQAVALLRRYSLVEVSDGSIALHRLVQLAVRDGLEPKVARRWAEAAVRLVGVAFQFKEADVASWPRWDNLLPHALVVAKQAEACNVALKDVCLVYFDAGSFLWVRAQFALARTVLTRALTLGTQCFGPDHPNLAVIGNNLGRVLQDLGDLAGAKAHYERALAISEAAYGPGHPKVATCINNLGLVLKTLGDLAGAKAHYERALTIDEAAYGPDHSEVATDVNNLGSVLQALGDLAEAKAQFERALAIGEAAYGPKHPNVASHVNNLGAVLAALGDLSGAKSHFERALAIDEAVNGPDHPKVAIRLNNLGGVLQDLGDLAGARVHYERALAIAERVYGSDHPSVNTIRGNLQMLND